MPDDVTELLAPEEDLRTAAESIDRASAKLAACQPSTADARDLAEARERVVRVYARRRAHRAGRRVLAA